MIKGKTSSTGKNDGIKYIEIPEGWMRILQNDSIHYVSPNNCCLKSYENIIEYLKTDGTCKCGLDCPFYIHCVFNFDSSVQNKERKDDAQEAGSKTSSCKLCESNRLKGSINSDQVLTPSPLNQALKQAAKTSIKPSTFDGTLSSKKGIGHSRAKLDSPKVKKIKKVSSPLSDIPSPPPIPISSPVQNVPNNLGANQGPLPSFASIVSSSKFFNPGPNRGPLHPTGSLPLTTNEQNAFAFPKPISSAVTMTSVSVVTTSSESTTQVSPVNNSHLENPSLGNRVPATVKSTQSARVSVAGSNITSAVSTTSFVTVPAGSVSSSLSNAPTSTVASIISTPMLPSLFSPLDGTTVAHNEAVKLPLKAIAKSKSKPRARPSARARPKPRTEQKLCVKPKLPKVTPSSSNNVSSEKPAFPAPSLAVTTLVSNPPSSHWPVLATSVMNNMGQKPYHSSSFTSLITTSSSTNLTGTSTVGSSVTGNLPITKPHLTQSLPDQTTVSSSMYMSQNYQTQGIRQQCFVNSSMGGSSLQSAQTSLAQTGGGPVDGKGSTASQTVVAASMNYPVVATPRIQAQPGMMYVTATPGMFPASYPYVAAPTQQMQISQGSFSQTQNKSSMAVTTMVSSTQQTLTGSQGGSSEAGASQNQGKVSFQVPEMYVQGTTPNQMFPLNPQSFNMVQYKGTYPLPSAMYQAPMQGSAMAFIAPNTTKSTYPGVQALATGNLGQFAYQNPYMFGIVMPPSTNQPSSTSVASTRSSPSTTCVTTSLQMIQPQTLQNPAVAAAFESFVPIAPAAGGSAPRFAQTLAHLASAYNTFPSSGILQGTNASQIQLAYQMMQMGCNPSSAHSQQMAGLIATDLPLKHPITPSPKHGTQTSTATVTKSVTHVPAKPQLVTHSVPTVISTMAQTTKEHPIGMRSPFSTTNANSSLSVSSPPGTPQLSAHTTSVCTQNTSVSYLLSTEASSYNYKTLQSPTRNQTTPPASTSSIAAGIGSSSKTYKNTSGTDLYKSTVATYESVLLPQQETSSLTTSSSTCMFTQPSERTNIKPVEKRLGNQNTDQREHPKAGQNTLSHGLFSTEQPQKIAVSPNGKDVQQHESPRCDINNISPLRTSNFAVSSEHNIKYNPSSLKSEPCSKRSILSRVEVVSSNTSTHKEVAPIMSDSKTATRTVGSNDSLAVKQTNFGSDDINYYTTNPLLGMKRSCEAIEVYPEPRENTDCNGDDVEDERDDYCSSNEDIERGPIHDDTAIETVRDLRQHGDDQHAEEQFLIGNQVCNPIKEMYNGGCNELHKEQELKNEHHGVNVKANQDFVAPSYRTEMLGDLSVPHVRPHFDIGDVVWAQARGLPSWPGQIVDESKVGKGRPDDGKKWVMWFGDHTFSQVEVDRLKTLSEGLRTLDDKTRKKKHRAKKARISMEQAIKEALEELEMRERLKAKQGMRSKTKKKRLR